MQQEQQQPDIATPAASALGRLLLAVLDGMGYSVEAIIRHDIGERRCRAMGGALFFALGVPLTLALFIEEGAKRRCALPAAAWTASGGRAPGMGPPPAMPGNRLVVPPPPVFVTPDLAGNGGSTPGPMLMPASPEPEGVGLMPFLIFCGLSVLGHVNQRVRAFRRRGSGRLIHTYYSGTPNILPRWRRWWPSLTELTCKLWLEPLICLAVGLACLPLSVILGLYLCLAGMVINHTTRQRKWQDRETALDATDGLLNMEFHQEKVAEESEGEAEARPAARVVEAAPQAPSMPPPPRPQPSPQPQTPPARPTPTVEPHLAEGLDPRLKALLEEQPPEDWSPDDA